ncbi:hypothetical protein [Seonamhaeicola sp.]|uniref:hypothetical protein n=1 Tax=Seonamhaeicola sp. TaxID=1912245 RepID=UPI00260B7FEF|nr:hypothetical protein [Seonamhaeicola sp.]
MNAEKTKNRKAPLSESVRYGLSNIEILEFNLKQINESDFNHEKLSGNLGVSGDYEEELSEVKVTINVRIEKNGENPKQIGNLKVMFSYYVDGLEKLEDEDGGILPKSMVDTFNAISISTTRGILFTKFQATILDNFILPLIDHTKLTSNY